MTTHTFTRAVTIVAVGFLLLNAVLLAIARYFLGATVCAVAAVLSVAGWFWYRRTMRELVDESKQLKREVEELRDLLHTHRRN